MMDTGLSQKNILAATVISLTALAVMSSVYVSRTAHTGKIPKASHKIASAKEMVDPNTASYSSLCRLPGIGPVTAGKIMEYRNKGGRCKKIGDLADINGIGPVTIFKIRNHVKIAGENTPGNFAETGEMLVDR